MVLLPVFKVIWLTGCVVGLVIQGVHAARLDRVRIPDERNTGLERLLTQVLVLGVLVFPVIYVGTPWLDFANYLPTSWQRHWG